MKTRGLLCDQVILTALIHIYSKAGNLKLAKDTYEEMKLLGVPLDNRSYGAMVMAYVRAGVLDQGEFLRREMEAQEIYAKREVYKAVLRAYSMLVIVKELIGCLMQFNLQGSFLMSSCLVSS